MHGSAVVHALDVHDESAVLDCSDVERTLFFCVHLHHWVCAQSRAASACSISTNMLRSCD